MSKRTKQIDLAIQSLQGAGIRFAFTEREIEGEKVKMICIKGSDASSFREIVGDFLVGLFEEVKIKNSLPICAAQVDKDFAGRAIEKGAVLVEPSRLSQEIPHILGLGVEASERKAGQPGEYVRRPGRK